MSTDKNKKSAPTRQIVRGYSELAQALDGRGFPSLRESMLRTYKNNGTIPGHNLTHKTILFDVDEVVEALLSP